MRTGAWLGAIVAAVLVVGPPAHAHDSLAPPGAAHEWLPAEDWVYRHWVPFDDALLRTRLALGGRRFERHLCDDHRTFAQRARRRGMDALFVADFAEGLRLEVADLSASWRLLVRRRRQLACWMRRPLPIWDPTHPYGDAFKWHGPHAAGWPSTARERREDRREMRRRLAALRRGCWSHVHH